MFVCNLLATFPTLFVVTIDAKCIPRGIVKLVYLAVAVGARLKPRRYWFEHFESLMGPLLMRRLDHRLQMMAPKGCFGVGSRQ